MISVNVMSLFPTPIGYSVYEEPLDEIAEHTKQLKRRQNVGNESTEDNYLFKQKEFEPIAKYCDEAVQSYFNYVHCPKHTVRPYITQSWANVTAKTQFHHKHAHPNSFISGVFYLEADEEKDKIYFYRDQTQQIEIAPREWHEYNSKTWFYQVKAGVLLLFPSWLSHSVETVDTERDRVSIAFNTFLMGSLGENETLTELIL